MPGGLGPDRAEAEWRRRSWGSQMEFERGVDLSHDSAACETELLGEDALSTAYSGPAASALSAEQ